MKQLTVELQMSTLHYIKLGKIFLRIIIAILIIMPKKVKTTVQLLHTIKRLFSNFKILAFTRHGWQLDSLTCFSSKQKLEPGVDMM